MFITNDAHRSESHSLFGAPGEAYWRAAEIALFKPWYLVSILQREMPDSKVDDAEDEYEATRSILVADIRDLLPLLARGNVDRTTLESVHVVTPAYLNGSGGWQMDRLVAIWRAQDTVDGEPVDLNVEILETVGGKLYPTFPMEKIVETHDDLTLVWQSPAEHP